jgi:hypothetical protein
MDVLAALVEQLGARAGFLFHEVVVQFDAWCHQQVREHGGTVVRETHRIRKGRRTIERRVEHFPQPKSVQTADPARRSRPRARGAGRPKAHATRSSARSGDGGEDGEDGPSEEPPELRLCENQRCEADITRLGPLARYCDNAGACKQQAWRDRRTLEDLDEIAGTVAEGLSCVCEPEHNVTEHGHCLKCGCPRGVVRREWVTDPAPQARTLVVMRGLPPHDLRVRPDRELSTKLRRTRRDRKVAA